MTDRRDRLVGQPCTLGGQPAQIVGRFEPFATVRTIDPAGPSHQWSWDAVERIMASGGAFRP